MILKKQLLPRTSLGRFIRTFPNNLKSVRNRKTFKKVAGHPKRDNPADSLHDQRSLAILHSHTFGKKAKTAYQHKHHILAIMHGDTEVKI